MRPQWINIDATSFSSSRDCCLAVEIIRRQYTNLATQLHARVVAAHLYQRKSLTLKDLQSIRSLGDRPIEAAEKLLDVIMEQPDAVYRCFLEVLKDTDQRHIYNRLVEHGCKG